MGNQISGRARRIRCSIWGAGLVLTVLTGSPIVYLVAKPRSGMHTTIDKDHAARLHDKAVQLPSAGSASSDFAIESTGLFDAWMKQPTSMPSASKSSGLSFPMFGFDGGTSGAESCFCQKAQNPTCTGNGTPCECREGCDINATGIVVGNGCVTFPSTPTVSGCSERFRILTI